MRGYSGPFFLEDDSKVATLRIMIPLGLTNRVQSFAFFFAVADVDRIGCCVNDRRRNIFSVKVFKMDC